MKRRLSVPLILTAALLVTGAPVLEAKPQNSAPNRAGGTVSFGPNQATPAKPSGGGNKPQPRPVNPPKPGGGKPKPGGVNPPRPGGGTHQPNRPRPSGPPSNYRPGYGYRPGYCPPYRPYPYRYYPYSYPRSGVVVQFGSTYTPVPVVQSIQVTPDLVAGIQDALNQQGYNAGPVDGVIGPRTQNAIASYQADRGLRPTGLIDAALLRSLGMI